MNVMSTGLVPVGSNSESLATTSRSVDWSASAESGSEGLQLWQLLIQALSLSLICLGAMGGNFLVFFSLLKKDQLRIPSNRLVFSLTASNFVLAVLVFPFAVASLIKNEWIFGVFWCNFTAFLTVLVTSASVLTIGVITVDRYLAIVRPLVYTLKVTRFRCTLLLLSVWIVAFSCAVPPLLGWSKFRYHNTEATCMADWSDDAIYTSFVLSTTILLPLGAMIVCYYFIFQVIRKKCRKIHVGRVDAFDRVDLTADTESGKCRLRSTTRRPSSWRFALARRPSWLLTAYASPTKGLRTICVVIGVFLLTSAPYLITALARACSLGNTLPSWFQVLAAWLWLSSSATHPIVYGLLNRSIRKELMKSSICPYSKSKPRPGSERTCTLSGRFSKSISLLDFTSLKLASKNDNWSSVASVETCGNYSRKGSQDSGTVMTESDIESETLFFRRINGTADGLDQQLEPFPVLQALVSEASSCDLRRNRLLSENSKTASDKAITLDVMPIAENCIGENLALKQKVKFLIIVFTAIYKLIQSLRQSIWHIPK
uniref:G-protein coupled receptors family 1 profile domain-containing protein n=1 Tax=Strigamia maritima TaxID=126957 RepID=T1INC2_STRMM